MPSVNSSVLPKTRLWTASGFQIWETLTGTHIVGPLVICVQKQSWCSAIPRIPASALELTTCSNRMVFFSFGNFTLNSHAWSYLPPSVIKHVKQFTNQVSCSEVTVKMLNQDNRARNSTKIHERLLYQLTTQLWSCRRTLRAVKER